MQARTNARTRRPGPAPEPRRQSSGERVWPQGEAWLYGQALACVRRARVITTAELARDLGVTPGSARALLVRMHAEEVVGAPDMFGEYRVVTGGAP